VSVAHNGRMLRYPGAGGAKDAARWIAKGLGVKKGESGLMAKTWKMAQKLLATAADGGKGAKK